MRVLASMIILEIDEIFMSFLIIPYIEITYQIGIFNQFPNVWLYKIDEVTEWFVACHGAVGQGIHSSALGCVA